MLPAKLFGQPYKSQFATSMKGADGVLSSSAGDADGAIDWPTEFEQMLLKKLKARFHGASIYWNNDFEILYMHILDQSSSAARFLWHQDVEENNSHARVFYSLIILLSADGHQVQGVRIAGASKSATYANDGSGVLFDASLFHKTDEWPSAWAPMDQPMGGFKLGVFVGVRF